MNYLTGNHLQEASARTFHYRVQWASLDSHTTYFAGLISEPAKGAFGGLERGSMVSGRVAVGLDCPPLDLAIRSRVLSHIESTDFGEWKPPPPTWPGWYGPYL